MESQLLYLESRVSQLETQLSHYTTLHTQYHTILKEIYNILGNTSSCKLLKERIKNWSEFIIDDREQDNIDYDIKYNIIATQLTEYINDTYSQWIANENMHIKEVSCYFDNILTQHQYNLSDEVIISFHRFINNLSAANLLQSSNEIHNNTTHIEQGIYQLLYESFYNLNNNDSPDITKYVKSIKLNMNKISNNQTFHLHNYKVINPIKESPIKYEEPIINTIDLINKDNITNTKYIDNNKDNITETKYIDNNKDNITNTKYIDNNNKKDDIIRLNKHLRLLEGQLNGIGRGNKDSGSESKYYRINNKIKYIKNELARLSLND